MLISKACLWCCYWLVSYLHSLSLPFAKGKMSSEFWQNPVLVVQIVLVCCLKEVASCPKQRLLCYKVLQELVCNNKKLKAHPSFYQPYINHNINHWIISRACQRHQWNLEYSRKHTSHCETCIGLEDLGLHIYTSFCWLWSMEGGGGGGRFCLIATVLLWFLCMDKVMFLLHIYKGEVSDNCFIELSWFAAMGIVFQSIYCCTKPKD